MCDAKHCRNVGIHMEFINGNDSIQLCTQHKEFWDRMMNELLLAKEVRI